MSWKAWVPRIAGYALAPWTGGASIAIGEGIAQGVSSNEAVDKANAQQQAGTDAAMAEQRRASGIASDVYQQQRNDLAPYRDMGGQAASTLGGLLGFAPTAPAAPMAVNRAVPSGLTANAAPPATERHPSSTGVMTGGMAGPRTLAQFGQPDPVSQRAAITQSSYGAPSGMAGEGALVSVKAPNGRLYRVPSNKVQEAVQNGGQVVA
ncbi:MAG TPA: hypothetical protein VHL34_24560 [Rhizomicrobium sp.]|jgi:hypothetical protein|nr:hypothetical protein [Rhizomicrobium sp.]